MYDVVIYFNSGERHSFSAEEFDIDTEASPSAYYLVRFTYKSRNGDEMPIYLTPTQVAGIIVEPR